MVKFTGVFDNSFASPMSPLNFVKEYYLTEMGRRELVDFSIKQESTFAALKNEESAGAQAYNKLRDEIADCVDRYLVAINQLVVCRLK